MIPVPFLRLILPSEQSSLAMGSQLSSPASPRDTSDADKTATIYYSYKRSAPDAAPNPVPFSRSKMSPEVLCWLKQCNFFKASEKQLRKEGSGFTRCVDYPQLPGHTYYEGYFNALYGEDGPVTSMNPRTGKPMEKPGRRDRCRKLLVHFNVDLALLLRSHSLFPGSRSY